MLKNKVITAVVVAFCALLVPSKPEEAFDRVVLPPSTASCSVDRTHLLASYNKKHFLPVPVSPQACSLALGSAGSVEKYEVMKTLRVTLTAYSASRRETDAYPKITASGTVVRSGIVATNWLPLGALVRIPAFFGDQVLIAEDRMGPDARALGKKKPQVDIYVSHRERALLFGVQRGWVEVLRRIN